MQLTPFRILLYYKTRVCNYMVRILIIREKNINVSEYQFLKIKILVLLYACIDISTYYIDLM